MSIAPADYAPLDPDTYKHQARLLLAQHCARPVTLDGRQCHIHTASSSNKGRRVEMTVYMTGDPTPIDSAKVSIPEGMVTEMEILIFVGLIAGIVFAIVAGYMGQKHALIQVRKLSDEEIDDEIYWAEAFGDSTSIFHDERTRREQERPKLSPELTA